MQEAGFPWAGTQEGLLELSGQPGPPLLLTWSQCTDGTLCSRGEVPV